MTDDNKQKQYILSMIAESYIHPGSGQSTSHVDLPVARERVTNYPFISSTSLKGSLKNAYSGENANMIFGNDSVGRVLFSDARLLLLPVRSLSSLYYWVTCPYILERLSRDFERLGHKSELTIPTVEENTALCSTSEKNIYLEELQFETKKLNRNSDESLNALISVLEKLISDEKARDRLSKQLVILNNDDFLWFASFGLPVLARNQLNNNKVSNNLWYEEYLPVDTVMYSIIIDRGTDYEPPKYLQVGGNESVGQGWFKLAVHNILEGENS